MFNGVISHSHPHYGQLYNQSIIKIMKIFVAVLIFAVLTATLPNQSPIIGIFTQIDSSDEPTAPYLATASKTWYPASPTLQTDT